LINVEVTFGEDKLAQTSGSAHITDGTSNTLLVAERAPTTATCEDTDEDGVAGLAVLEFQMRNVRTGELVAASVLPLDGDIDDGEQHPVAIRIGNRVWTGWSSFYRSL
jgi:hypothetical protein